MELKLYSNGDIETLDTSIPVNQNNVMVNVLKVYADFLTEKQKIFVAYQFIEHPNGAKAEDELKISSNLALVKDNKIFYELIPKEVVSTPGKWKLELRVRTYLQNSDKYTEQLASQEYVFPVNQGIPNINDGETATVEDVKTLQASVERVHEKIAALGEIPLQEGKSAGAVQQYLIEDEEKKGSLAYGKYSAAFNKDNKAYQRSSFATGGGNEVGLSQEEFLELHPSGYDETEEYVQYNESNSFGFVGGQENKAKAKYSAVLTGRKNETHGKGSAVVAGQMNIVYSTNSAVLCGYYNLIEENSVESVILNGHNNTIKARHSVVAGSYNEIESDNTVALGQFIKTDNLHGSDKHIIGSFNDYNSYAFFQLSNGTSEDNRKNLVEAFNNGMFKYNVTADGTEPYQLANMQAVKNAIQENADSGGNVDLNEYVKKTDYADIGEYGLIKLTYSTSGLGLDSNGSIKLMPADRSMITAKDINVSGNRCIPAYLVDETVKTGVTTNNISLTDEEKTNACDWMGAVKDIGVNYTSSVYARDYAGVLGMRKYSETPQQAVNGNLAIYHAPSKYWYSDDLPGALWTAPPQYDGQCATKKYVDEHIRYNELYEHTTELSFNKNGTSITVQVTYLSQDTYSTSFISFAMELNAKKLVRNGIAFINGGSYGLCAVFYGEHEDQIEKIRIIADNTLFELTEDECQFYDYVEGI